MVITEFSYKIKELIKRNDVAPMMKFRKEFKKLTDLVKL